MLNTNNKRSFEREIVRTQTPNPPTPSEIHERECEDRAVRMGIMTDRPTYQTFPSPLQKPNDGDSVWLFIPARTSKRSIQNLADTCGEPLVCFYIRARCLSKYVFSNMDVAFHFEFSETTYYMLPVGTFSELQVHVLNPEQNPAALQFAKAQMVVPLVPTGEHDA